jgi:hypothetical protein
MLLQCDHQLSIAEESSSDIMWQRAKRAATMGHKQQLPL